MRPACYSFRHAVALKPDFVAAYNNIGLSLIELGQTGEAQEAFRKALDIEPRNATVLSNLSHAKKFAAGDPHLGVMQELLANPELLSESERIELNFALGKVYADLKDHRRSFEHLLAETGPSARSSLMTSRRPWRRSICSKGLSLAN